MRVNRITGVGLNAVACLRNVITESVIVFLYTVVKQRKELITMKESLKNWLIPLLFTFSGALVGLAY